MLGPPSSPHDRRHPLRYPPALRAGGRARPRGRRWRCPRCGAGGVLHAATAPVATGRRPRSAALAVPDRAARGEQPPAGPPARGSAARARMGANRDTLPRGTGDASTNSGTPRRGRRRAAPRSAGALSPVRGGGLARAGGRAAAGAQPQHHLRSRASAASSARPGVVVAGVDAGRAAGLASRVYRRTGERLDHLPGSVGGGPR